MNYETDLLNFERHCLSLESAWRSESEPDLGAFIDSIDGEIMFAGISED